MILVNNPGNWNTVYAPLLHAEWHGWTPTDLVFPFFLFIVGVSIVLAFHWRLEPSGTASSSLGGQGSGKGALVGKILRRGALLFALGLFLSGYPFGLFGPRSFERLLETWRIPGVLQRIAVCYVLASLLFLAFRERALRWWTLGLLFGYWVLLTLVPVPGIGVPNLDSKGDHLAGWLDRVVFGNHLWISAKVYDPEGILSTLPALATTLFGVFAGLVLITKLDATEKAARLFLRGFLLTIAGTIWSWFLPLNKALWTSSYAVFTAGLATSGLALCFWVCDLRGHRRLARPLVIYGVNALTVFVGSGVLAKTLIYLKVGSPEPHSLQSVLYQTFFSSWLPPYPASFAYALAWVGGWYLVLAWMHRRGLVLKV
ncbi:MAG: DUF5009 domain-containing protein [Deltaproteobacteria bacterium]|nr:DUF5009 domain-containing protein [Deltaproteobacteria bacterium]